MNRLPEISRVKELLSYDKETGEFTWISSASNRVRVGEKAGCFKGKGYASIAIDGKAYRAHRLAWLLAYGKDPDDMEIDHIDRDKGNNAIANLRLATRQQNNRNIGPASNNSSGVRGVSFQKSEGRWAAYIYENKKKKHLGLFPSLDEAASARLCAQRVLFAGRATEHGIKP